MQISVIVTRHSRDIHVQDNTLPMHEHQECSRYTTYISFKRAIIFQPDDPQPVADVTPENKYRILYVRHYSYKNRNFFESLLRVVSSRFLDAIGRGESVSLDAVIAVRHLSILRSTTPQKVNSIQFASGHAQMSYALADTPNITAPAQFSRYSWHYRRYGHRQVVPNATGL